VKSDYLAQVLLEWGLDAADERVKGGARIREFATLLAWPLSALAARTARPDRSRALQVQHIRRFHLQTLAIYRFGFNQIATRLL